MRFKDKKILVTGAGCGIGFEICKHFVEEGAVVALNDKNEDLAISASESIGKTIQEGSIIPLAFDVSNVDSSQNKIQEFSEQQGGIDIFIANAGLTIDENFLLMTPEMLESMLSINLKGTFFNCQAVAKEMIRYKKMGRLILMSSVTGFQAHPKMSGYGMTKAGIRMLVKTMALELGVYGITVNAISPGATLTERTLKDPDYKKGWDLVSPNHHTATTRDISNSALFLSSSEAKHITGEVLMCDGGWTTCSPVPNHLA